MITRQLIDDAIGETRHVGLDADGRAVSLHIERWSDADAFHAFGDAISGRVIRVAPHLGGAFVELERGPPGFLPSHLASGLGEGARVDVIVAAEASPSKGPRLKLRETGRDMAALPASAEPRRDPAARAVADLAVAQALEPTVRLPGGGFLTIEPTRALVAVDVDAGDRSARAAKADFVTELNQAAAAELAREIALRRLSGLVVVDFVNGAGKAANSALVEALSADLSAFGVRAHVAPLSRLGLCEIAVERTRRALHEVLCEPGGALRVETIALEGLRALEREGAANRSARLVLRLHTEAVVWLQTCGLNWRDALAERLGARFSLEADPRLARAQIDAHVAA